MKILVVAPSWIGDTILAQPLLALLKRNHPAARIEVLAPDWSAPLLARMAEVDAVVVNPFRHGEFAFWARRTLGRRLGGNAASADYSHAYVLPNSWKSALVPFFAGIPRRIGYRGEARYLLLNDLRRLDVGAHPQLVQRYAALAGPLPATLPQPHLSSTMEQQQAARRALSLPLDVAPILRELHNLLVPQLLLFLGAYLLYNDGIQTVIALSSQFGQSQRCTLSGLFAPGHCEQTHATDQAYYDKIWYWSTPQADCADSDANTTCKDQDAWVAAWTTLRGG